MDAVYILGDGSVADDEEIRYSIRSLEKNMLDLDHVFVVGDCPDFLTGVTHIGAKDKYDKPWKNAMHKTEVACDFEDISDNFLLMNDDFFLCEPFYGAEFPFYSKKGVDGGINGPKSFQLHCPIKINKEMYPQLPIDQSAEQDYSPRSFYANLFKAPPTPEEDCIVRNGEGLSSFDDQVEGRQWFSIGDRIMLSEEFQKWIDSLYPEPSTYEE